MKHVISNVYLLKGVRGANVCLLVSDGKLTLVDSGLANDVDRIIAQMQIAGFELSVVTSIVLTHSQGDHIGGALDLAGYSGAKILAHRDEVPYPEQNKPLPEKHFPCIMLTSFSKTVRNRLSQLHVACGNSF